MAESPAGIREHIESQADRFKQEATKLFSLEEAGDPGKTSSSLEGLGKQPDIQEKQPASQEKQPVSPAKQPANRPLLFARIRQPILKVGLPEASQGPEVANTSGTFQSYDNFTFKIVIKSPGFS